MPCGPATVRTRRSSAASRSSTSSHAMATNSSRPRRSSGPGPRSSQPRRTMGRATRARWRRAAGKLPMMPFGSGSPAYGRTSRVSPRRRAENAPQCEVCGRKPSASGARAAGVSSRGVSNACSLDRSCRRGSRSFQRLPLDCPAMGRMASCPRKRGTVADAGSRSHVARFAVRRGRIAPGQLAAPRGQAVAADGAGRAMPTPPAPPSAGCSTCSSSPTRPPRAPTTCTPGPASRCS